MFCMLSIESSHLVQDINTEQQQQRQQAHCSPCHRVGPQGQYRLLTGESPRGWVCPFSSRRIAASSSGVLTSLAVSFQKLVGYPSLRPSTSTGAALVLQALRISLNSITSATLRVMMPAVNSELETPDCSHSGAQLACRLPPSACRLEADTELATSVEHLLHRRTALGALGCLHETGTAMPAPFASNDATTRRENTSSLTVWGGQDLGRLRDWAAAGSVKEAGSSHKP